MKVEWKGGNLTKKRAAFLCWNMWEWIAETLTQKEWVIAGYYSIDTIKNKWPEWSYNGGKVESCHNTCMSCEQVATHCEKCMLLSTWGGWDSGSIIPCTENVGSPYKNLYGQHRLKTAKAVKKRARLIANAAKKVYEGCK